MLKKKNDRDILNIHSGTNNNQMNILKKKNDRDILNIQQPATNNNQMNIIPIKTVLNKTNIINNRILLNLNKKLIIDPQNKAKLLKTRPIDNIYKDKVTHLDLSNFNYSNL